MHSYATTKELKKKAFTINSQNLKQAIGIQVTFILETKLKKIFLAKYNHFLAADVSYLSPW